MAGTGNPGIALAAQVAQAGGTVIQGDARPPVLPVPGAKPMPYAGQHPYLKGGYAPTFISLQGAPLSYKTAPNRSPALDAPDPVDPTTGYRYDQIMSGHQNRVIINQAPHHNRSLTTTAPDRWPGAGTMLPRLFAPNLGGLSGISQRGFHQGQSRYSGLYHLNPLWALRMLNSARAVSQKVNRMAGAVGVPGVFVPTSPANMYRGRGSY